MRNPDRLDDFYKEFCKIHKESFPDWRVGQTMTNFLGWMMSEKKRDAFFSEEEEFLKLFKEFTGKRN